MGEKHFCISVKDTQTQVQKKGRKNEQKKNRLKLSMKKKAEVGKDVICNEESSSTFNRLLLFFLTK
jgi:hypothetical protein